MIQAKQERVTILHYPKHRHHNNSWSVYVSYLKKNDVTEAQLFSQPYEESYGTFSFVL